LGKNILLRKSLIKLISSVNTFLRLLRMGNMDGFGNVQMEVFPNYASTNLGDKCIYRHALPPGYVLKSQKKDEDEEEKITLEQFIETARHQLPPSSELKAVTMESFEEWHKAKKKAEEDADLRKKEIAKERGTGITGREFFQSGGYEGDVEEEDGEDWDLSQFRKGLAEIMEEGESFQLGNGNPQVEEPQVEVEGQEDEDQV
jgi:DRG Family Regulatory Proteins, Tma46